jgi:hypothetical protein
VIASAAVESGPLLFNWESPRRRKLTILTFLAASFVGHVFCFYVFQIVYPPTVAILPPPVRISLISPTSEEGRSLLRWIEAEDPALAFATQRPPDARLRALPKVEHVPSYAANEPAIQEIPPLVPELRTPSSHPPGPVPIVHEKIAPVPNEIPTSVSFSNEFAGFGAPQSPATKFASSNNESLQALRFRMAVNGRGEIRHCFAVNSSGDPALDEQARQHLVLCRFPTKSTTDSGSSDQSLTWGLATVEWGNDVARPQAKSTTAGAP